jgi:hypothetical protein
MATSPWIFDEQNVDRPVRFYLDVDRLNQSYSGNAITDNTRHVNSSNQQDQKKIFDGRVVAFLPSIFNEGTPIWNILLEREIVISNLGKMHDEGVQEDHHQNFQLFSQIVHYSINVIASELAEGLDNYILNRIRFEADDMNVSVDDDDFNRSDELSSDDFHINHQNSSLLYDDILNTPGNYRSRFFNYLDKINE